MSDLPQLDPVARRVLTAVRDGRAKPCYFGPGEYTLPFPPGTRVYHHRAQQYPEAIHGTATVIQAEEQRSGGWEYLVQRDKPLMPGMSNEPVYWASYHVAKAITLPAAVQSRTPVAMPEHAGADEGGIDG